MQTNIAYTDHRRNVNEIGTGVACGRLPRWPSSDKVTGENAAIFSDQ